MPSPSMYISTLGSTTNLVTNTSRVTRGYRPTIERMHTRTLIVIALLVSVLSACSGEFREVVTNSGGVLDCNSDTVLYVAMDAAIHTGGAANAEDAIEQIGEVSGRPPGEPTVERVGEQSAVYTFRDNDGRRTGRAMVEKHSGGWFVQSTERCG